MTVFNVYIGTGKYDAELTEQIIKKFASKYFHGYTLVAAQGYWEGKEEDSYILEVITDDKKYLQTVTQFATKIKSVLEQEAVLVTMQTLEEVKFI